MINPKKSLRALWIPAVVSLGLVGVAQAQFIGPGAQLALPETVFDSENAFLSTPTNTVAEILKNPVDDTHVRLKGNIRKRLRKKHYEFSDGTGVIRVKIGEKIFIQQPVDEKTVVELFGEVEKSYRKSPEIDVKIMRIFHPSPRK